MLKKNATRQEVAEPFVFRNVKWSSYTKEKSKRQILSNVQNFVISEDLRKMSLCAQGDNSCGMINCPCHTG